MANSYVFAQTCSSFLSAVSTEPELFLHQRNGQLHISRNVEKAVRLSDASSGERTVRPKEKIRIWLNYLKSTYENLQKQNQTHNVSRIKNLYFKKYVLPASEVPESYFEAHVAAANAEGGNLRLEDLNKTSLANNISNDQKESLNEWLTFFLSKDSEVYPMWVKYWALSSVVNMGRFNHDKGYYSSRSKDQLAPFPELNLEAFAKVVDATLRKLNKESLSEIKDPVFLERLEGLSFSKIYGHQMALVSAQNPKNMKITDGIWLKFQKGSDSNELYLTLNGRNSGWCVAGKATAESMLKQGDFHIYLTRNENNEYKVPRIAIRFIGDKMQEVRGIAKNQNLDSHLSITPILNNKLAEFGNKGLNFIQASEDTLRLSRILEDSINEKEVSLDDLRFIYEIDRKIEGIGQKADPRIRHYIQATRDIKFDLMMIFNFRYMPSQISLTTEEAVANKSLLHYGDLDFSNATLPSEVHMPQVVLGDVNLPKLRSVRDLTLPKHVSRSIHLDDLRSISGLRGWPDVLHGSFNVARVAFSTPGSTDSIPEHLKSKVVYTDPIPAIIGIERGFGRLTGQIFRTIPLPP